MPEPALPRRAYARVSFRLRSQHWRGVVRCADIHARSCTVVTARPSLAPPLVAFNVPRPRRPPRQFHSEGAAKRAGGTFVPGPNEPSGLSTAPMQKALYECIRGRPQALRMSAPPSPHAHERPEPPPAAHFFSAPYVCAESQRKTGVISLQMNADLRRAEKIARLLDPKICLNYRRGPGRYIPTGRVRARNLGIRGGGTLCSGAPH